MKLFTHTNMDDTTESDFITSKEAAEITGYSQDYIGQLARSGRVEARRIGGLWHLGRESLMNHKSKADSYVPVPPRKSDVNIEAADRPMTLNGRDFVSTAEAASITGYHVDYVGQLAREAVVSAENVGGRWFVDKEALIKHKEEKDSLLAEVQARAVGLTHRNQQGALSHVDDVDQSYFTYSEDKRPLMPEGTTRQVKYSEVVDDTSSEIQEASEDLDFQNNSPRLNRLPIRVFQSRTLHQSDYEDREGSKSLSSRGYVLGIAAILILLTTFGAYYYFAAGSPELIYIRAR